jgi:hypothetical protein
MGCRGWLALEDVPLGAMYQQPDGGMDATGCPDRTLYERLTQLNAWMCDPQARYVRPSVLNQSLMHMVVNGDSAMGGTCVTGANVPLGRMPKPPEPLLDADSINKIDTWIMMGAPNN